MRGEPDSEGISLLKGLIMNRLLIIFGKVLLLEILIINIIIFVTTHTLIVLTSILLLQWTLTHDGNGHFERENSHLSGPLTVKQSVSLYHCIIISLYIVSLYW